MNPTDVNNVANAYNALCKGWPHNNPRKVTAGMLKSLQKHLQVTSKDPVRGGVIILREYNHEDTLVIGCGNDPCYVGGTPTHLEEQQKTEHSDEANRLAFWREYRTLHTHPGCYTVNPNIGYNPSVIGRFGIDDFRFLPAGCFKEIVFEGFRLETEDNVSTVRDVLHLLAESGNVSFCAEGIPLRLFSKFDGKLYNGECVITNDNEYKKFK